MLVQGKHVLAVRGACRRWFPAAGCSTSSMLHIPAANHALRLAGNMRLRLRPHPSATAGPWRCFMLCETDRSPSDKHQWPVPPLHSSEAARRFPGPRNRGQRGAETVTVSLDRAGTTGAVSWDPELAAIGMQAILIRHRQCRTKLPASGAPNGAANWLISVGGPGHGQACLLETAARSSCTADPPWPVCE